MAWYWLSFADPKLPEGRQFLGAVIVQATEAGLVAADLKKQMIFGGPFETSLDEGDERAFAGALETARLMGLNPGGECQGMAWPEGAPEPPAQFTNRLLSREDCAAFDRAMEALPPPTETGG